ncbi:MAG TPA: hypothetical protein PK131_00880 [Candidatus Woesebacteria bacterium]|nr:hypothetical protein [Candidatus Woesebacteria bacterium]HRT40328.1 hypothetical protein [Candidatus Woesebacteria bacterium]
MEQDRSLITLENYIDESLKTFKNSDLLRTFSVKIKDDKGRLVDCFLEKGNKEIFPYQSCLKLHRGEEIYELIADEIEKGRRLIKDQQEKEEVIREVNFVMMENHEALQSKILRNFLPAKTNIYCPNQDEPFRFKQEKLALFKAIYHKIRRLPLNLKIDLIYRNIPLTFYIEHPYKLDESDLDFLDDKKESKNFFYRAVIQLKERPNETDKVSYPISPTMVFHKVKIAGTYHFRDWNGSRTEYQELIKFLDEAALSYNQLNENFGYQPRLNHHQNCSF